MLILPSRRAADHQESRRRAPPCCATATPQWLIGRLACIILSICPPPPRRTTVVKRCYRMSRLSSWYLPALPLVTLLGAGPCRADDIAYSFGDARRFLGQFCVACHGPEKPKGKLNLKRFETPGQVHADRKVWDEVLSRVRD